VENRTGHRCVRSIKEHAMNYADKIARLKHFLASARDLAVVQDYFLTHFAEDEKFLDLGKPLPHAFLETVLQKVVEGSIRSTTAIQDVLLIGVPEYRFIHGCGFVDGWFLSIFYFEEEAIGLAAVTSLTPGAKTHFARFSRSGEWSGQPGP
jgi:hypothetical protein